MISKGGNSHNGTNREQPGGEAAPRPSPGKVGGWCKLILGLGLFWLLAEVILPWGQTLPAIQPTMTAIRDADVDVTTYWYTQSEITAEAEIHVRNTMRR